MLLLHHITQRKGSLIITLAFTNKLQHNFVTTCRSVSVCSCVRPMPSMLQWAHLGEVARCRPPASACMRACMRACVRACVHACAHAHLWEVADEVTPACERVRACASTCLRVRSPLRSSRRGDSCLRACACVRAQVRACVCAHLWEVADEVTPACERVRACVRKYVRASALTFEK